MANLKNYYSEARLIYSTIYCTKVERYGVLLCFVSSFSQLRRYDHRLKMGKIEMLLGNKLKYHCHNSKEFCYDSYTQPRPIESVFTS